MSRVDACGDPRRFGSTRATTNWTEDANGDITVCFGITIRKGADALPRPNSRGLIGGVQKGKG
jgi:hypothetical protein